VTVQRILRDGPFSMRQWAEESGLSYAALRAWAAGARVPEPESLQKLAGGLRQRIDSLSAMVAELDRAAESERGAP
jgi:transcriptional regulator with XRE-family HTH domain